MDDRSKYRLEEIHNRTLQTVDLAAVLKKCSRGELEHLDEVSNNYFASSNPGLHAFGAALLVMVDAAAAILERDHALMLARFDAIAAENPKETGWIDLDPSTVPKWSEDAGEEAAAAGWTHAREVLRELRDDNNN
ncbi:hypothetical protein [Mycolicibacterium frederiksbergense]|uniref:hypothetical protein n=1 Tax=Mycolicibacterium frederiksbergense TaxID=117567 RepID=UPI00265BF5AF|nr:hypothetical protein [Mycolicibacterium frederiksbergense]MDO0976951.1 hypothetical protein [Mycolicibacterium frederiksbergense]